MTALTVSDTAYAIATIRAREAERDASERLFEDPYAPLFAAAGEHAREGIARFEALPFFVDGIRLRTRHIDDLVRNAIRAGTRQLVLMGAGFDTRGLRLDEVARHAVRTFEVDLPALLDVKRSLLDAAGVALPASLHPIPTDFTADFDAPLLDALVAAGFVRDAATVFVWEGVIAYLDPSAVERSLRFMATASGPGTRVVFDFSDFSFDTPVAEIVRAAGFDSFLEVPFDRLWRIHLAGDPPRSAAVVKIGVAGR